MASKSVVDVVVGIVCVMKSITIKHTMDWYKKCLYVI